jgi:hypothetical protein
MGFQKKNLRPKFEHRFSQKVTLEKCIYHVIKSKCQYLLGNEFLRQKPLLDTSYNKKKIKSTGF